jgi:hypothetical protein
MVVKLKTELSFNFSIRRVPNIDGLVKGFLDGDGDIFRLMEITGVTTGL